jgi:DNA-binding SARP family transcriptional activator
LSTVGELEAGTGELQVRLVGGLAVCRAGRPLRAGDVGSRKARIVLAVLAVHGGYVPVDRMCAVVWGDSPPHDPIANLATLVSRLRAALGRDVIAGGRGGYRLGSLVGVDLSEIADLVARAHAHINARQPALALMAARRAAHRLDQGIVLAEHPDADWAEAARVRHGDLLRRARHITAEAALRTGDTHAARAAAEAAVAADGFDEAACRLLMRAQHAAGEPAQAILSYQRLRVLLASELGVDPAPATRTLHLTILRDTADAATQAAG